MKLLKICLKDTFAVALAYLPLGMGFGILATQAAELSPLSAFIISICVYAGSGQYALAAMIAEKASLFSIVVATLLINSRHFFYTLTLLSTLKAIKNPLKFYIIFALTDETFAILSTRRRSFKHMLLIAFLNHFYWILGCTLGAIFSSTLKLNIKGLDFVLIAFFTVLAIELARKCKNEILFAGICIAIFSALFFHGASMLIACMCLALGYLAFVYKRQKQC